MLWSECCVTCNLSHAIHVKSEAWMKPSAHTHSPVPFNLAYGWQRQLVELLLVCITVLFVLSHATQSPSSVIKYPTFSRIGNCSFWDRLTHNYQFSTPKLRTCTRPTCPVLRQNHKRNSLYWRHRHSSSRSWSRFRPGSPCNRPYMCTQPRLSEWRVDRIDSNRHWKCPWFDHSQCRMH